MSKNFSTNILHDRYANALYEYASKNDCLEKILEDLDQLRIYYKENKQFYLLLSSPLIPSEKKLNVVREIFKKNKSHDVLENFMHVIQKNKRFGMLIAIIERLKIINLEKRGNITADVTSAQELDDSQKSNILSKLQNLLGKKLNINYYVDKSLISGLIIRFGSKMFDSSMITKINKLKLAMKGQG